MDLTIDKLLYKAVNESTEIVTPQVVNDNGDVVNPAELLSNIPIFYLGDKNMMNAPTRIVMGRVGNEPLGSSLSFSSVFSVSSLLILNFTPYRYFIKRVLVLSVIFIIFYINKHVSVL